MLQRLRALLGEIGGGIWGLVALQAVVILRASWGAESWPSILAEILAATLCLFLLAYLTLSAARRLPAAQRILSVALQLLFIPLLAFHFGTGYRLRYDLLRNTADYLLQPGVLHWVLFENGIATWLFLGGGLLAVGVLAVTGIGRPHLSTAGPRGWRWLLALALYATILCLPRIPVDDLTLLARSVLNYYTAPAMRPASAAVAPYPYVKGKPGPPVLRSGASALPHVFIVFLESLNARYIEARTEEGTEYTPFLNSLIPRGAYVERFYGNSVQTCRGQMTTLCGTLPSLNDREFVAYPELSLHCLPRIFKDLGYTTIFMEGYSDLGFDNTGNFMKHLGFDETEAMTGAFVKPEDQPSMWGWGMQDDAFYRKVFQHLDELKGKRLFVSLMSASNHMWFDQMPEDQRLLFGNPKSVHEHYANSVHLADSYLKEFFAQLAARPGLENSLVVVVGDHSFPTREKFGRTFLQEGFTEEVFRTPLLILWPGRMAPRRIGAFAYSQVDIAPSLLDLLGVEVRNHFVGTSLFDPAVDHQETIFLVQPYGGTYVAEELYPMKYVRKLESSLEFLYDLERDPEEAENLIWRMGDSSLARRFRAEMGRLTLNQQLLEEDRIWPRDEPVPGTSSGSVPR